MRWFDGAEPVRCADVVRNSGIIRNGVDAQKEANYEALKNFKFRFIITFACGGKRGSAEKKSN